MIRVVHPGSRIRMLTFSHPGSRIPDPGVKKHPIPDPGSGSATLEKSIEFSCFEVLDVLFSSPVAWASFMEA